MDEGLSMKKLFMRVLILVPLIYMGFGWYIGLNYAMKSAVFGPYPGYPRSGKDPPFRTFFGGSL